MPTSTGTTAAGSVAGRAASSQTRGPLTATAAALTAHGNRGYFEKSGLRFSRNAFLPSLASSVR